MTTITHYIAGSPARGTANRTQPVFNPATGEAEKEVILASEQDVNDAVAAAKAAWPAWSKTPSLRRARILDKFKTILWERADQLAEAISAEHGKTHDDALGEGARATACVDLGDHAPASKHRVGGASELCLFDQAIEDFTRVATELLDQLVTNAPPKNREVEAKKARERAAKRFA